MSTLFKIEFSDLRFRVVAPDANYEDAVAFTMVSTVEYAGKMYGAFLTGSESELDELTQHPTETRMRTTTIKVYDLSKWPTLSAVDTEIEEIEFDEDEEEEEGAEGADVIEVEPGQ